MAVVATVATWSGTDDAVVPNEIPLDEAKDRRQENVSKFI
jgi:hypothetical protein